MKNTKLDNILCEINPRLEGAHRIIFSGESATVYVEEEYIETEIKVKNKFITQFFFHEILDRMVKVATGLKVVAKVRGFSFENDYDLNQNKEKLELLFDGDWTTDLINIYLFNKFIGTLDIKNLTVDFYNNYFSVVVPCEDGAEFVLTVYVD